MEIAGERAERSSEKNLEELESVEHSASFRTTRNRKKFASKFSCAVDDTTTAAATSSQAAVAQWRAPGTGS